MHNRNNRFNFLWEKMFFLRKNIFVVPAIQVRTAVKTFRNAYCIILEKKLRPCDAAYSVSRLSKCPTTETKHSSLVIRASARGIARALGTSCVDLKKNTFHKMNERNRSKKTQQHQKTEGPMIVHFHIYCPLQVKISEI